MVQWASNMKCFCIVNEPESLLILPSAQKFFPTFYAIRDQQSLFYSLRLAMNFILFGKKIHFLNFLISDCAYVRCPTSSPKFTYKMLQHDALYGTYGFSIFHLLIALCYDLHSSFQKMFIDLI